MKAFFKKNIQKDINPTKLIVLSFFAVIITGALLLSLPFATNGEPISVVDAFFTATSATCVTGLVVFDTYTKFTLFGQIVILCLIQIGGLGLVTLTSFINVAIGKRLGFKGLRLASESVGGADISRAGSFLKFVMKITFSVEALGAVLLCFVFVPDFGLEGIYIAIFTAISAFCNAGFDVLGRISEYTSLTTYAANPYLLGIISALIICGGLGFIVWFDLLGSFKAKRLNIHTKLVLTVTASLLALGTVAFAILEWGNAATIGEMGVFDKISNSFFQSVSTRTAGFNSIDLMSMGNVTKALMIMLMFVGAAPGGTGGGIKITTISVIIVAIMSVISGKSDASIRSRRIDQKTVYKSLAIFMLSASAVMLSAVTIFFNSGPEISELSSVFEATSAFATVGLSAGATSVMNPVAKIVTMLTMFIGRVGPIALAITLSAKHEGPGERRAILPDANIIVG